MISDYLHARANRAPSLSGPVANATMKYEPTMLSSSRVVATEWPYYMNPEKERYFGDVWI